MRYRRPLRIWFLYRLCIMAKFLKALTTAEFKPGNPFSLANVAKASSKRWGGGTSALLR